MMTSRWEMSDSCNVRGRRLADRHYSRQKPGSLRFVPPGRCLTLVLPEGDAVWATSWPFAEYVRHAWAGAWVCSIFRNESPHLSSDLIREAVAVTRWYWPDVPDLGMVTFADRDKLRSSNPGYCYMQAGFVKAGKTAGGLRALRLLPANMPEPMMPIGSQIRMAVTA
jgi:hypothetical protein